jgi:hypothetical protein
VGKSASATLRRFCQPSRKLDNGESYRIQPFGSRRGPSCGWIYESTYSQSPTYTSATNPRPSDNDISEHGLTPCVQLGAGQERDPRMLVPGSEIAIQCPVLQEENMACIGSRDILEKRVSSKLVSSVR